MDALVHRGHLVELLDADELDLIDLGHLLHLRRSELGGDRAGERMGLDLLISRNHLQPFHDRLQLLPRPLLEVTERGLPVLRVDLVGLERLTVGDRDVEGLFLVDGLGGHPARARAPLLVVDQRDEPRL